MSSVIITGPKSLQETVIKELHSLKILHIVDHTKNEFADIGMPLESANALSELMVKIRAIMSALSIKKENFKFEIKKGLSEIDAQVKKLSSEVNSISEDLKKTQESLSKNESAKQELNILKELNVPLENFTSYKSLAYFTGYVKSKDIVAAIKVDLSVTTKNFMLVSSDINKKNFITLFVDVKSKDYALNILQKYKFSPQNFAHIAGFKGTASSNLKKIEEESLRIKKRGDELRNKLEKIRAEHAGFLLAAESFLEGQLEKAEAPLRFASTQSSFLIKGWLPKEDLPKTIDSLNKVTNNRIFVHFEEPKKKDKVPVKLKNPAIAKSFEFFLDLYSMPSYREIDPTFFVFLSFPIFFGVMLGDIGYGLTSLAVFWLLKKKMSKAKNFFNILMLASFVSILFGFFFGEFFGYEIYHSIISREHEMFKLMIITIVIGVIHVNLGLIIGFINEFKFHGFIQAIYTKASWIIFELGLVLLVLSHFNKISITPWFGAGFLGASILMLLKGEGFKGIIEIPSIFANILSYVRLAAIGLTSVIMAVIINESARGFFHKGNFYVLAGVLILIVGHIINISIGLLASFLHSLRLHYVEFFSKFFAGGAKKYKPFGLKEELMQ